ncbi:hypothetical protein HYU17_05700 [Candidatus Woesearchaeota archaeon]|nr:hypothetical protein [Candidatus Woesearchaeota archaeon]
MRLPKVGSEVLARTIESVVSESEASGNFSGLKTIAGIIYSTAIQHSRTGNISRAGVLEWLEAAKSAYMAALDSYQAQQGQVPGFVEDAESRIAEIERMRGCSLPYDPQQRRFAEETEGRGLQPMPQPLGRPRRVMVAVAEREGQR